MYSEIQFAVFEISFFFSRISLKVSKSLCIFGLNVTCCVVFVLYKVHIVNCMSMLTVKIQMLVSKKNEKRSHLTVNMSFVKTKQKTVKTAIFRHGNQGQQAFEFIKPML